MYLYIKYLKRAVYFDFSKAGYFFLNIKANHRFDLRKNVSNNKNLKQPFFYVDGLRFKRITSHTKNQNTQTHLTQTTSYKAIESKTNQNSQNQSNTILVIIFIIIFIHFSSVK